MIRDRKIKIDALLTVKQLVFLFISSIFFFQLHPILLDKDNPSADTKSRVNAQEQELGCSTDELKELGLVWEQPDCTVPASLMGLDPKVKSISGLDFLQVWKGRTLVLYGDSLTEWWAVSLRCLLKRFQVDESKWELASSMRHLEGKLIYHCDAYIHEVIVCFISGMTIDGGEVNMPEKVLGVLYKYLESTDIIVANAGLHWHEKAAEVASKFSLVWNSLRHKNPIGPSCWWREIAPQHFPGTGEFTAEALELAVGMKSCPVADDNPYNRAVNPILEQANIPIVSVYDVTKTFSEAHFASKGDCTHYCQGEFGPYPAWTSIIAAMASTLAPEKLSVSLHDRLEKLFGPKSVASSGNVTCCGTKSVFGKDIPQILLKQADLSESVEAFMRVCCPHFESISGVD
jgi:hypothetical protein